MKHAILLMLCVAASACGVATNSSGGKLGPGPQTPLGGAAAVPRAVCGPGSVPERALQGQVPLPERMEGFQGTQCNLELVGQWQDQGASWQHAWYGDCAYFDTRYASNIGTVVIDASDPARPVPTEYLKEPAMLDPWESLKVNQQRGLLAGVLQSGNRDGFSVYDVTGDCRHPQLKASIVMENTRGHEGNWSQDGLTYYGSSTADYYALDVTDPGAPSVIAGPFLVRGSHGLSTSKDDTRGYFVSLSLGVGAVGDAVRPVTGGENAAVSPNGLMVVDLSEIQSRAPNPEPRILGEVYWEDGSAAQHTVPMTIGGKPYVLFVDELGPASVATNGAWTYGCATGLPPFGFPRIIDIADETNPKVISKLMLETHDPANCSVVINDVNGQAIFSYDSHYCYVDDEENTTAVACGYFNSGIRVFDVRDPLRPREIAYFNPRAAWEKQNALPGSNHIGLKNADWCSAQVRFHRTADGGGQLWTTCQDNGFLILKFTNGAWPFASSKPVRRR
jgi:hypothetical protein